MLKSTKNKVSEVETLLVTSQACQQRWSKNITCSRQRANPIGVLVGSTATDESGALQSEAKALAQFNAQFAHFLEDSPACDICGSITVRNGTCYKCYNCGNSMGCS